MNRSKKAAIIPRVVMSGLLCLTIGTGPTELTYASGNLASPPAGSPQDRPGAPPDNAAVRKELEAQYLELAQAHDRGDLKAILGLRTADFHAIFPDGKVGDNKTMEQYSRQFLEMNRPPYNIKVTIQDLVVSENTLIAVAEVLQEASRQRELAGRLRKVETSVRQRETWAKTADGWKLKSVDSVRDQKRFVDGKRVDPTKPYDPDAPPYNPGQAEAGKTTDQVQQHAGHPLGTVDFPVSCSEQARAEFNRAVALLHHMTYPQARAAFEQVAATDPRCAMAHWGVAMTLFQPLWPTRPGPAALRRGWESVQKARALQPPTERERLFVAAAEAFFLEPASSDYWLRIRRWEQASKKVHASFPDDPEAAAFYALAHLATAPSDTISRAHSDRAAELLLRVYEGNPDHPGAMHYLVHANDVPGREQESLEITRKYEAVAPRNPHALHMPTHIYTRLGDWNGVIRGNLRAAEAALEHPAGDHGEFVWDEFPHAIEYLVYAYLQKGADDDAAAQLKRLRATARLEPTFKTAFHLASTQARHALERRAWDEAARIVAREPATLDWDRFAWPEAIARFARGLGAAHLGKVDEARAAGARLEELEAATRRAGEDLFARNIRVLRLELNAWLAHAARQGESSVALMREAAELEASTPKHAVTPGPTLPAHEQLGDLLMERKQPAEALVAYRRSMELHPGRFNGLLGAARAAQALGDASLASTFYQELLEVADGGTRGPALKEARNFVAR